MCQTQHFLIIMLTLRALCVNVCVENKMISELMGF